MNNFVPPEKRTGTDRLFKYRPWNMNTANFLVDFKLYHSRITDFNDPYDSRASVPFTDDPGEWENTLRALGLSSDYLPIALNDR